MKSFFSTALAFGLFSLFPVSLYAQPPAAASDTITPSLLKAHLEFIASDELEGRLTPSHGLDVAAKYIAANLSRLGFTPMGDKETFFQNFALSRVRVEAAKCSASLKNDPLEYGKDYVLNPAAGKADGELIYAGYGWRIGRTKTDPYAGLSLKGKTLVVTYAPDLESIGLKPADFEAQNSGVESPEAAAQKAGAAGVIYLVSEGDWERVLKRRLHENTTADWIAPVPVDADNPPQVPTLTLSPDRSRELLRGEAVNWGSVQKLISQHKSVSTFALNPAKRLSFENKSKIETRTVCNVVAKWPGSDPALKEEYVAVSAHYDHIGTKENAKPGEDAIYNGADDDGSGTVGVLSIAEALAKASVHPKRSTLLIWHCGEEEGLWGSGYFVQHPVVPLKQIVSLLNIDMIGRSKPKGDTDPADKNLSGENEIYVIGSRKLNPRLGDLSERVNAENLNLKFDYKYDAPNDPENLYERSDHFNYAKKGVPIIFYFDGVHRDYHGVGDKVSKIDFRKMERVTRTVYATLWELAESGLGH